MSHQGSAYPAEYSKEIMWKIAFREKNLISILIWLVWSEGVLPTLEGKENSEMSRRRFSSGGHLSPVSLQGATTTAGDFYSNPVQAIMFHEVKVFMIRWGSHWLYVIHSIFLAENFTFWGGWGIQEGEGDLCYSAECTTKASKKRKRLHYKDKGGSTENIDEMFLEGVDKRSFVWVKRIWLRRIGWVVSGNRSWESLLRSLPQYETNQTSEGLLTFKWTQNDGTEVSNWSLSVEVYGRRDGDLPSSTPEVCAGCRVEL